MHAEGETRVACKGRASKRVSNSLPTYILTRVRESKTPKPSGIHLITCL